MAFRLKWMAPVWRDERNDGLTPRDDGFYQQKTYELLERMQRPKQLTKLQILSAQCRPINEIRNTSD